MYLKCERLDDFGRGICFFNGKIVFVPNMLPSEEGKIKIILDKRKYMIGELLDLKVISPSRVRGVCEYLSCGCHLMHMNYDSTLDFKVNKVKNILRKFGGIDVSDLDIITSDIYGYRNKVTLKVSGGKLGFFRNGTHDIVEIERCPISSFRINEIISVLRKEDLSKVYEIVIKDMDGVMVSVKGFLDISSLKGKVNSIYMNDKLVYGEKFIKNMIGDFLYLVSPYAFFQVNDGVTIKLYEKVREFAGFGHNLLDLFCGCGTIGIFLSKNFDKVIGIDINKSSIECARENANINGIDNTEFLCGDANTLSKGICADVVVVDPARGGLSVDGIYNIMDISPRKIIYVSCNPVTLARDLKLLDRYEMRDIILFDMFPFTYHVECVTLLCRKTL